MTRGNVLVVDDDPELRELLNTVLTNKGYKVLTAASGKEAYRLLKERYSKYKSTHVNLIVSDWLMPNGNGLDLLGQVRKDFENEDIPFVMISSGIKPAEVINFVQAGADTVVIKPFQMALLIMKMEEAITLRGQKRLSKRYKGTKSKAG
jgi:two-component system, chemotaxis family, chemotaxis protein CheY